MQNPDNYFHQGKVVKDLDLSHVPVGEVSRYWVQLATNGLGWPVSVPVLVARGKQPGPILGVTAAVHGNELNGIPVIQRMFRELDLESLSGTIVGALVVNAPGYLQSKRRFIDGRDLNHIMPGKADGNNSEIFAYRLIDRLVKKFDYLVDLHTASTGRVNSYYIRADMDDAVTDKMARLQSADIIVHNPPHDGTLRGASDDIRIPSITLEVGDPNRFQKGMIRSGLTGLHNLLIYLQMQPGTIEEPGAPTVICESSYWIYTQQGGLLTVFPKVTDIVEEGEVIAEVRNVFGDLLEKYLAPERGIVIGKSVSPVNQSGGRILHLGIMR